MNIVEWHKQELFKTDYLVVSHLYMWERTITASPTPQFSPECCSLCLVYSNEPGIPITYSYYDGELWHVLFNADGNAAVANKQVEKQFMHYAALNRNLNSMDYRSMKQNKSETLIINLNDFEFDYVNIDLDEAIEHQGYKGEKPD